MRNSVPSLLVLPDNTLLVNFAHLNRMDLLARLVSNGAWCASVAAECDRSATQPGLESMADAHEIFGEPLRPENGREHVMTQASYASRSTRRRKAPPSRRG